MNDRLERIWKEAVVAWLFSTPEFAGGNDENHENLSENSLSQSQVLISETPEYEAGVWTSPWHSVWE
jgi:hypothetical protein